jgi:endoglucanase
MQWTAGVRRYTLLFALAVPVTASAQARQQSTNVIAGRRLYVDPNSNARRQAETLRRSRPQDAALLDRIASQPVAKWLGGWVGDVQREVGNAVKTITGTGALPVFVAYNIPQRDCGSYSAGGASGAEAYRKWIAGFAAGLQGKQSIVILEPDALPGMDCLDAPGKASRIALLRDAVRTLKANGALVYIDAGHASWQSPETMAARLKQVDIAAADGFSLNVSNYQSNAANIAYGEKLSRLVGGKHFLIDTSRNGIGTTQWCNPRGQALGVAPTTNTGHPLVDAFLWIKQPGESDGTCGGGPKAGNWWSDIAIELSRAASSLARTIGR